MTWQDDIKCSRCGAKQENIFVDEENKKVYFTCKCGQKNIRVWIEGIPSSVAFGEPTVTTE